MTIDPPSEQLKRLYEKTRLAGDKIDEFQRTSASERSQSFEKLALLNGGAIVLSVTFIGYFLSDHGEIKWRYLLHGAWVLLLLSLLACLMRNFFYQNYVYYSRVSPYVRKLAEQADMEVRVAIDPSAPMLSEDDSVMTPKEREEYAAQLRTKAKNRHTEAESAGKRGRRAERIWRPCEPVALVALFLGLTMLVWFAVLNTR
ncbi:MAG TPA: hypothetical protein VNV41_16355 [Candidatus Acidoferrales bacterium]|jgi:hypothetical protein|nr:hypothetical protein [Candidatus Acidoferrales bacterium]